MLCCRRSPRSSITCFQGSSLRTRERASFLCFLGTAWFCCSSEPREHVSAFFFELSLPARADHHKYSHAVRKLAFWRDHGDQLQEQFPPSDTYLSLREHVRNLRPLLSCQEGIIMLEALPDGTISAVFRDLPTFYSFKTEYQAATNTEFTTQHAQMSAGTVHKTYDCR